VKNVERKGRFLRYISGEVKFPAILFLATLCACQRVPEYPVPAQRTVFDASKVVTARIINMDDPGATSRFVRDISPDLSSSWRWAFKKPAVRIRVRVERQVKYFIDFTLPEITFRDTGPVTIAFTVNDRVLDTVRYTQAGYQHFEKPVPVEWIHVGQDAIVGAEIDKVWVSKDDGKAFGFIISRIGLN
jgi:hypothetical protein